MDLIPNQKEKNMFFAGINLSLIAGVIGSFFVGSFFRLTEMSNYSTTNMSLILFDSGLFLLILMIWFRKQIKPIK